LRKSKFILEILAQLKSLQTLICLNIYILSFMTEDSSDSQIEERPDCTY